MSLEAEAMEAQILRQDRDGAEQLGQWRKEESISGAKKVIVLVWQCCDKQHSQKQPGKDGVVLAYISQLIIIRHGAKLRQELKQGRKLEAGTEATSME